MIDAINWTYVIVDALGGRRARLEDVVVVAMIDQQDAAGLEALLEVLDRPLVLSLLGCGVHQVSKGVAQADDCIEAGLNLILDIVIQRQPVGLFDGCRERCELQHESLNTWLCRMYLLQLSKASSLRRFQRSLRAYFSILSEASTETTSNPSSSSMMESTLEGQNDH